MQNGHFLSKSALLSKKVCYKVSLGETVIVQSMHAIMVGWSVPFYVKIWLKLTHPFNITDFQ